MSEDTPLIAPPKPDDARKSVEVVGQLTSVSMPQFIPAQPGWRLAVLGPDEDLEACPIVAWEVGDDAYMTPWARLHAQDGYGVARCAMSAACVVGLLAPGEELDSGWYEAAKEVTEALRTPPVVSETALRVVCTDLETGDEDEREVEAGDYCIIAVWPLVFDGAVSHKNGTTVLTLKKAKDGA